MTRIRTLTGGASDRAVGLSAEGRVTSENGRFHLRLLVRDGTELRERAIASDTCTDLAGAAAVTLVLLLGMEIRELETPVAVHENSPPAGEETQENGGTGPNPAARGVAPPAGPRATEGASELPTPNERTATQERPWALALRAPVFTANLGPLPSLDLRVGLGVGVQWAPWRFLLSGHLSRLQDTTNRDFGQTVGVSVRHATLELELSRGWRSSSFEIAPFAGLALEYLGASGFGEGVSSHATRTFWPAPFAGTVGYWHARKWLAFFVHAHGYLELSRPRLVIGGLGEVDKTKPYALGISVGTEWLL